MVDRIVFNDEATWVVARGPRIGSSDSAGILGCGYSHQVKTSIWLEKAMGIRHKFTTASQNLLREGKQNEADVLDTFAVMNPRLRVHPEKNCFYVNQEYPNLCASLDAWAEDEETGERFVVEAKWLSEWNAKEWGGESAPMKYLVQVMHQLIVMGWDRGYLAAKIGGKYQQRIVERHDRLIAQMLEKYRDFWRYVTENKPPIDDSPLSFELLRKTKKADTAKQVGKKTSDHFRSLAGLLSRREELESEVENIRDKADLAKLGIQFQAVEQEIVATKNAIGRESIGFEYLILDDQSVLKLGTRAIKRLPKLPRGVKVEI